MNPATLLMAEGQAKEPRKSQMPEVKQRREQCTHGVTGEFVWGYIGVRTRLGCVERENQAGCGGLGRRIMEFEASMEYILRP